MLLLRPSTALLVVRSLGDDAPPAADVRLLAGTVVTAVVLLAVGTVALTGASAAVPLVVTAVVAVVGAEALGRALDRPEVRARLVRAGLAAARRVSGLATSLVRRAGAEPAARRR